MTIKLEIDRSTKDTFVHYPILESGVTFSVLFVFWNSDTFVRPDGDAHGIP
jgi:hypothetical protein